MKVNFGGSGWVSFAGMLLIGSARGDWPHPPDNIREHVVSLKEETPALKAAREHLAAALSGVTPEEAAGAQISATTDKGYLVWGDLFKTGNCFALYEPKMRDAENAATLGLAEWSDGKWELRGLWKMPLHWVPQDDRWSGDEYKYVASDTLRVPFELEDLIGDEAPEVIISGEKTKYHQARYVMKFDPNSRGLELLTYSMRKPEKAGKYLRLYDASGNKAIWSEWTFLEWMNGKLEERAVWRSVTPYDGESPSFTLADVTREGGKRRSYRIDQGAGGGEKHRVYSLSQSGQSLGSVMIDWESEENSNNKYMREMAWFFHKLTGLPREHFPEPRDGKVPEALEVDAKVSLDGGAPLNMLFYKQT